MNVCSDLVKLKDDDFFQRQKVAGRCVGDILKTLDRMVTEKTPNLSLRDMEAEAVRQIEASGCTATFKGYKGFPGSICLSVNEQLVHGIPSDYILQEGDVVKFDLGATYQGAIADAASTAIYGKPKSNRHVELIDTCKKALAHAISVVQIGKQIGCIGYAIHRYVTAKTSFKLVTDYGGHGICIDENGQGIPHAAPFVANKAKPNEGIRIQPGLVIAIEPMLVIGESAKTHVLKDGWTVCGVGISAHVEHSLFVREDGVHVMTDW